MIVRTLSTAALQRSVQERNCLQFQEEHAFLPENKATFPIENINVRAFCVLLVVLGKREKGKRGRR